MLNSYVGVLVNGWSVWVADDNTERTTAECYFSNDGGTTAVDIKKIQNGYTLYWNALNAGYGLTNGTHYVDLVYRS